MEKVFGKTGRRQRALARLEAQVKAGNKTQKKSQGKIPLEEKDTKRINKEIAKLKELV